MITVYGDVLFAVNFFMDFLILRLTGLIVGKTSFLRSISGALIGAIYATTAFFISMPTFLSFVFQMLLAVAMVAVTFGFKQDFRIKVLVFFGISVFCSGVVFIIFLSGGAFIVNGTVYFSAGIRKLIFSSIGCYYTFKCLGTLINTLADRRFSRMKLQVALNEKTICVSALCDNGNSLHDPFTGLPVCILQREIYNQLCPENEKIYVIPYKTISGENHIMTGFKPSSASLTDVSGKTYNINCIVAVTDTKIKKGTEAIVSPCMLTDGNEHEQHNPTETLHNDTTSTAV